jgi:hypothetical protein
MIIILLIVIVACLLFGGAAVLVFLGMTLWAVILFLAIGVTIALLILSWRFIADSIQDQKAWTEQKRAVKRNAKGRAPKFPPYLKAVQFTSYDDLGESSRTMEQPATRRATPASLITARRFSDATGQVREPA